MRKRIIHKKMTDRKEALKAIKKSANELLPGSRILLFGSQAREDSSAESDYDFLVITKKPINIQEKRHFQARLRTILAKYKIPVDVLIQSEAEVKEKKKIIGHIIRDICKESVAI